jgi:sugar lactone lactonase YvrE
VSLLSEPVPLAGVLSRAHSLLESPRVGPDGEVVYSDVIAGGVWRCDANGSTHEIVPKRRGVGGIVPHADGGWVISGSAVLHVGAGSTGGTQRAGKQEGGARRAGRTLIAEDGACGYNDLFTTPAGALLAGELRYRPLAGEPEREGRLLALEPAGELRVLSESVVWPNGVGLAPDTETVYLSDYARRVVLAVPLSGGATHEFCRVSAGSPDGLAVDVEGGVWVALGDAGAVARFDRDGELDALIDVPAGFVSSISFNGVDGRDVLISTADNRVSPDLGGTLLRARSEVEGLLPCPAVV